MRLLTSIDSTASNAVLDALTNLLGKHAACYLFESDANGCFSWLSPELSTRLQIPSEALIGRKVHSLVTINTTTQHALIDTALTAAQLFSEVSIDIDAHQQLAMAGVPMLVDGNFAGCLCVFTEAKEKSHAPSAKSIKSALSAHYHDESNGIDPSTLSNDRVRDFINTAAQWFFEWDDTPRVTYLSAGFSSVAGIKPLDQVGNTPLVFEPSTTSSQMAYLQSCMSKRQPFEDIEFEIVNPAGEYRILKITGTPFYDDDGEFAGYRGCGWEVTTQRQMQRQAEHEARHDPLTSLINRREFERQLAYVAANSNQYDSEHFLAYLDLDRFKVVNDSAGHAAGDDVLCKISQILSESVKDHDIVARIGGDEFGLLLLKCSEESARKVFERIIGTIRDTALSYDGRTFSIGASIGAVKITPNNPGHTESMVQADLACYAAKELGRGRYQIYSSDDPFILARESEVQRTSSVVETIRQRKFILYGQPVVSIAPDTAPEHDFIEVLLRLPGLNGARRSPASFIPIGEKHGLAIDLDLWVIESVLNSYEELMKACEINRRISINLSGVSISDSRFAKNAAHIIGNSNVPAEFICFEITETAAIQSIDSAKAFISTMKKLGCRFALDDFGSGFSSFSYLQDLDVDYIKIDGKYVQQLTTDAYSQAVAQAMCHVGRALNLMVVAEHVENEKTLLALKEMGVQLAQGHHLGVPISLGDALVDIDTELVIPQTINTRYSG